MIRIEAYINNGARFLGAKSINLKDIANDYNKEALEKREKELNMWLYYLTKNFSFREGRAVQVVVIAKSKMSVLMPLLELEENAAIAEDFKMY